METKSDVLWEQTSTHPPEELIELYAMGSVSEAEEELIEEHLFCCESCRNALVEADQWVALVKSAIPAEPPPRAEGAWLQWWRSNRSSLSQFQWPALAGVVAVLLAVWGGAAPVLSKAQQVNLSAVRGRDLKSEAVANRPLQLQFEKDNEGASLDGSPVTIVNSIGDEVWSGKLDHFKATAPGLKAGGYWVRLFTPRGEQIKEYGLIAR